MFRSTFSAGPHTVPCLFSCSTHREVCHVMVCWCLGRLRGLGLVRAGVAVHGPGGVRGSSAPSSAPRLANHQPAQDRAKRSPLWQEQALNPRNKPGPANARREAVAISLIVLIEQLTVSIECLTRTYKYQYIRLQVVVGLPVNSLLRPWDCAIDPGVRAMFQCRGTLLL